MSMHLEGPWLSTTGKKKGKKKFASAEHARKAREQAEAWEALQKKWAPTTVTKPKTDTVKSPVVNTPFIRDTGPRIESLPFTAGPCTKAPEKVYTGTKIKGIGTMHKSNAVPIFSDEEAQDIAKMRR